MTDDKNRWLEALAQMIKLTQEGKLTWESVPSFEPEKKQEDDTFSSGFVTDYKGRKIRIYKRIFKDQRLKSSISGSSVTVLDIFGKASGTEHFWNTEVIMEFTDAYGNPIWSYPQMSALSDLLSAVQYQVAGVKDFLDDILGNQKE